MTGLLMFMKKNDFREIEGTISGFKQLNAAQQYIVENVLDVHSENKLRFSGAKPKASGYCQCNSYDRIKDRFIKQFVYLNLTEIFLFFSDETSMYYRS